MFSANPYEEVHKEMSQGMIDQPLWLRSIAESGGDEARTTAIYIQHRAEMYAAFHQAEQINLRRAAKAEQAMQKRIAQAEREERYGAFSPFLTTLYGVSIVLAIILFATCSHQ